MEVFAAIIEFVAAIASLLIEAVSQVGMFWYRIGDEPPAKKKG